MAFGMLSFPLPNLALSSMLNMSYGKRMDVGGDHFLPGEHFLQTNFGKLFDHILDGLFRINVFGKAKVVSSKEVNWR